VSFYEKGKDFENIQISVSFKQFYDNPGKSFFDQQSIELPETDLIFPGDEELYGFTEDEKERVIAELKSRPGATVQRYAKLPLAVLPL
ncbi:hypothetical protein PSTG_17667, partial [Puccinia striiformis f. sp. tritici PST-78]